MAMHNFVVELLEALLENKDLGLTQEDIRFYDQGTTAENDDTLDSHIRWKNARYYNADSNVVRSSVLVIQLSTDNGAEYLSFSMGDMYRKYRKDGLQAVLAEVTDILKQAQADVTKTVGLLNQFGDLEAIRKRLILRPLNYDNNEKVLANGIYQRIGDMALVLYISMGNNLAGGTKNIVTAMVPRELFQSWKANEAELLSETLSNTMRLQAPVLCPIIGNLGSTMKKLRLLKEDVTVNFDGPFSPTLTTEQEVNGAIAAFYPQVQERLYQMVGGDFYLAFTSIHDVHIHPVGGWAKVSSMRKSQSDTNRELNKREEILFQQIYRYDGISKELVIV